MIVSTGHTRVGAKRLAVRPPGDKPVGPEVFGLAEIMRRYLFLESIGE